MGGRGCDEREIGSMGMEDIGRSGQSCMPCVPSPDGGLGAQVKANSFFLYYFQHHQLNMYTLNN